MVKWVQAVFVLFISVGLHAAPRLQRICASPDGINTIEWYSFKDTCQDLVQLKIFGRENSFTPFKEIGSTNDAKTRQFSHTSAVAFQKGSYFLQYTIRCAGSLVTVYSDTLEVDTKAPEVLDPDSVSIVNGEVVIGWQASKAADSKSYVIYHTVGAKNFPIDTVYGKSNTLYTDSAFGDPGQKAERYKIAAVDSCDNIAPIGNFHETVFLSYSLDKCRGEVYLSWTAYQGWINGVDHYEIFLQDSIGFKNIGYATGLMDTIPNLRSNRHYHMFVRAFKKGGGATSSSNVLRITPDFGDALEYLYISTVTFKDDTLAVNWLAPPHPDLDHFELWRGNDKAHMVKVAELPKTQFSWAEPNAEKKVTYIKVVAYNRCGNKLAESNISNPIVLSVLTEGDHRILSWNTYASWLNGVDGYEIYKLIYGEKPAQLLPYGTTEDAVTSFVDTASVKSDTLPGACYYIVATEREVNKLGVKGISISNEVCYTNPPIVYIPNAFVPHEFTNTHFRPSILNANLSESTLEIYNRWGQLLLKDVDINSGWDGTLGDGEVLPEGVYFYVLSVKGIDGSIRVYKGMLTLL